MRREQNRARRARILAAVLAVGALVAACATVTTAEAGPYSVNKAYTVTLGRPWSDLTSAMPNKGPRTRFLTIDGPLLNRLYLVGGLEDGGALMKAASKEKPVPEYRAGMSSTEAVAFVADTVAALGYQDVETLSLRPQDFAGGDGVRFDLAAATPAGLKMAGSALLAETDGRLNLMLYIAPAEHYYAAHLPEVEQIFASVARGPGPTS